MTEPDVSTLAVVVEEFLFYVYGLSPKILLLLVLFKSERTSSPGAKTLFYGTFCSSSRHPCTYYRRYNIAA